MNPGEPPTLCSEQRAVRPGLAGGLLLLALRRPRSFSLLCFPAVVPSVLKSKQLSWESVTKRSPRSKSVYFSGPPNFVMASYIASGNTGAF